MIIEVMEKPVVMLTLQAVPIAEFEFVPVVVEEFVFIRCSTPVKLCHDVVVALSFWLSNLSRAISASVRSGHTRDVSISILPGTAVWS
jgi:hypothetical protein